MLIEEYLKTLKDPISKRTVCFLLNQEKVLLGKKKRGLGAGNYLGIGGKVENGEGIIEAAIREMQEETRVTPYDLQEVAILTFLFPEKPQWNQEVHAFITYKWAGLPRKTDEITPKWFNKDQIPYNQMWDDNKYWIPLILKGNKLKGDFLYDNNLKVLYRKIIEY